MTARFSIFLLIILTFFKTICGQTYSSLVSDGDISNFFDQLNSSKAVKIHKLSPNMLRWSSILNLEDTSNQELPFYFLNKASKDYLTLKSSFGEGDIKFLKEQFYALKDSVWDFTQFKNFVPADLTIYEEISKKSMSGKRRIKDNHSYSFSVPLFSLDRKSVIIYQDYFCGALCSSTCIYLYLKDENGTWKRILSWSCWSS